MKEIPLTKGKVALVDDCDYEYLRQWKWFVRSDKKNQYAARWNNEVVPRRHVHMHRVVMDRMGVRCGEVDHIDRNPLNNQRDNLRAANRSQNTCNCGRRRNNLSGIVGVCWRADEQQWYAQVRTPVKRIAKRFKNFDEAVAWRDQKARELHGEFAVLNRPEACQ